MIRNEHVKEVIRVSRMNIVLQALSPSTADIEIVSRESYNNQNAILNEDVELDAE